MKQDIGPNGSWMAVVSSRRPDNVPDMTAKIGPATWYIPEGQREYYERFDAPRIVEVPTQGEKHNNLCESRNAMLEEAFDRDLPCVCMDDDLQRARYKEHSPGQPDPVIDVNATFPGADEDGDGDDASVADADLRWACHHLVSALSEAPYKLAGCSPTDNPYFARTPFSTTAYILTTLCAVEPTPLRYDTSLTLKEDYDYTMQHIEEHGGALRVNGLLITAKHYDNPGGAVDVRSASEEQQNISKLKSKWPDAIHDHPTRENEVVLRHS